MAKAIVTRVDTRPLDIQVQRAMDSWRSACEAIEIIHDQKLYKLRGYKTFKAFIAEGIELSKGRAYQLLAAAAQLKLLPPTSADLLADERASRELRRVPAEKQVELLEEISRDMPPGAKVKAKDIKVFVEKNKKAKDNGRAPCATTPKPKHASKPTDKLGAIIKNEKVVMAFDQAVQIRALIGKAKALTAEVEKLMKSRVIGVHIPTQHIITDLHNVQVSLRHGLPYSVCPKCKGIGTKCPACRRSGWITRPMFKSIVEAAK